MVRARAFTEASTVAVSDYPVALLRELLLLVPKETVVLSSTGGQSASEKKKEEEVGGGRVPVLVAKHLHSKTAASSLPSFSFSLFSSPPLPAQNSRNAWARDTQHKRWGCCRSHAQSQAVTMLSRKQQWRRIRCRPRLNNPGPETSPAIIILAEKEEADDEASSTTTSSIRSSDSIDSALDEAREEDGVGGIPDEVEGGGDRCGASLSLPASSTHARVTFEPVVQVFLVTHKNELDSR